MGFNRVISVLHWLEIMNLEDFMKKRMAGTSLLVMVIIFVIGLILIFLSSSIGERIGFNAIQNNGGSIDTSTYERIINSNTSNFRTVGLVVSLVGGFGLLLSGYALYKEL
jgi:uncharacterized membrane protein YjjP (DUF1212 family)